MKNDYVKEFPRAFFIGLSIFGVLNLIQILNGGTVSFDEHLKIMFLYTMLYSFALHIANAYLFISLDKIFVNERFSKKRIFIGFVSSFFLSLFVIFLLRLFISVLIEKQSFTVFVANESASDYIVASVFTFVVLLIVHFVYLYKGYQENKVKEQKIIAGTANAKFESLKNQIDPHFLFNTLNNIDALIQADPVKASAALAKLSDLLRYVVYETEMEKVSIQKEIDIISQYIDIEKIRLSNPDSVSFYSSVSKDIAVPPMIFLPFIENGFKHSNLNSKGQKLDISISDNNNELLFHCINTVIGKKENNSNKGIGIKLVRKRLELLYPEKHSLEIHQTDNEHSVTLKIDISDD